MYMAESAEEWLAKLSERMVSKVQLPHGNKILTEHWLCPDCDTKHTCHYYKGEKKSDICKFEM